MASTDPPRATTTWILKTEKAGRLRSSAYEHPQPHACFIQSVGDDLVNEGGIMDLWTREARLFKYGSGTGTNFSARCAARTSRWPGGGKSSGLMSFLKIGDRAAGAIKSGGTTRRAAKMVICDMDHPDIEQFIGWKVREEQKVAALVAGSKMHKEKLAEIMAAIRSWDGAEAGCFRSQEKPRAEKGNPGGTQMRDPGELCKARDPVCALRAWNRASFRSSTRTGTARPI